MFEGPVSFKEYIDTLAAEMGIEHTSFMLGGMFSYKYPNRYRTVVRPYFIVEFSVIAITNPLTRSATSGFRYRMLLMKSPTPRPHRSWRKL